MGVSLNLPLKGEVAASPEKLSLQAAKGGMVCRPIALALASHSFA
jgi:hypothetical protein